MARVGSTWTKTWLLHWSSIEPQSCDLGNLLTRP